MKPKSKLEQFNAFMEGKGFYIVLALCLAAVGVSGYYLYASLNPPTQTVSATTTSVVVYPTAQVEAARPTLTPTPSVEETPVVATVVVPDVVETALEEMVETTASAEIEVPVASATASLYTWPVKGSIVADYSLEVLAYDDTMGDWRVHSGVDIAATLGAQVVAISAGTVTAIEDDPLLGTTVVIDHGDGLTSRYANLATTPTVSVGDAVNTGTVIGAVGDTAVAESSRQAHLHLELHLDGLPTDPAPYLP